MFSVVIPLYNKGYSIGETLSSVFAQTLQDFEVVVVNDGSTDNSVEAIELFDDERIRLIHQDNQGVSAARNRGVREASYDWIAFLDGDDVWSSTHLQEISSMMKLFPDGVVFVTSFDYSDNRKVFKHSRHQSVFKINNYFEEAIKENLMWTSVVVAHKKCIEEVGGFNESINRGEDLDLWARLARKYSVVKGEVVTAVYNISSPDSLSKGKSTYSKSFVSLIDLRTLKSSERKYFKKIIYKRLALGLLTLDFEELIKLLVKHNIQLVI